MYRLFFAMLLLSGLAQAGTVTEDTVWLSVPDRNETFDATSDGHLVARIKPPEGEKIVRVDLPGSTCEKRCTWFVNVFTDKSPQPYSVKLLVAPGSLASWASSSWK